ncbi:MAG: UvrD-helicase domain-containing protein [Akkermansiaceae bacterium]
MEILRKNLLVLASAGSGKTYCLSDRIIGLMAAGVEPKKIVALTFTRKAAGEFATAIISKLAEAAESEEAASQLSERLVLSDTDFGEILERTVKNLPVLTLGTMDGFFTRVVKGFQYELGISGGRFDLLEGEIAEGVRDELTESLLDSGIDEELEDDFIEFFRRATAGTEGAGVLDDLRRFISTWHGIYLSSDEIEWGGSSLVDVVEQDWQKEKGPLIEQVRRDWPNVADRTKRHDTAFEPMLEAFEEHTVGSGVLGRAKGLVPKVLDAAAEEGDELSFSYYKPLNITGLAAQALRKLVGLAARCEFAAALARTRGIRRVIESYDELIERELRIRGKLGFDDVKRLMGAWMKNEDARLRREAVDFRLDANYDHWLLDEFQDTSRDEWNALSPLIDEGLTDPEASVFVVGDRKQAIYAWRGGEVGLFDELIERYSPELGVETMAESWRSSPEVLKLVNQVCGDREVMSDLFGEAVEAWKWEEHVSAKPLAVAEKAGYARVEVVEKDAKMECVIEQLKEIGIGEKALSCGILVSRNDDVRAWADRLRTEGFQVVEEGAREPGKDHPVGILVWQLLRWMADSSDSFARTTVEMSPVKPSLEVRFGKSTKDIWQGLTVMLSETGFAEMVRTVTADLELQEYGRRRLEELLQALRELDDSGVCLAREAADWIGRMKISQSPGVAAVQVMTVHKSKGLGFDVVVLPDIQSDKIPSMNHLRTIRGNGWVSDAPADWVRAMIPELREAESQWAQGQIYESFCKLYVALTRAKRGLYVFLDVPAKNADRSKPSFSNWIINSLNLEASPEEVYESGSPDWHSTIALMERAEEKLNSVSLGKPVPKRMRTSPSDGKQFEKSNDSGQRFGIKIHQEFERVGWLDEMETKDSELSEIVLKTLEEPKVSELFSRKGRSIRLLREQAVEAVMDGKWMSGVIDRLHLHSNQSGQVEMLEIIDFKTDIVESGEVLEERYASQMKAYQRVMKQAYPDAEIRCHIVSTALQALI